MALKNKINSREIELPDTLFVRDIENRVFQIIALQCLARIADVALVEGNLIDALLGRGGVERIKGVSVEQDSKNHSVKVRLEVNIRYGVSIPAKSDEIQVRIAEEITKLTGLHVASVHVIFKGVYTEQGGPSQGEPLVASPPEEPVP